MELVSKKCKSEKDDSKYHLWKGVELSKLFDVCQLKENDIIRISSKDNYQVDLSKKDLQENIAILALYCDGKKLDETHLRLIVPSKREMYWIKDVYSINEIAKNATSIPHIIYIAENVVNCNKPDKIKFSEFSSFFPKFGDNEYLAIAKDGISHSFSYDKYLKNAIIMTKRNNYKLLSKTMPLGMWINNLCFIQNQDTGIVFLKNFKDMENLAAIMKWKFENKKVTLIMNDGNKKIVESKIVNKDMLKKAKKIIL
jgi:hypothetical protein